MIFRPRNLIQLSLLYLPLNLFWTAMLLQVLPLRIDTLIGDKKGIGFAIVSSGGAIVATLCMFLVGPLSDNTTHRFGRRFPWIVGGILVGILGALLFPFARTLPVLLLAFVLARLGFATAIAGYEAILPDRVPIEFRSRASGWNEMFDVLGQFGGLAFTALLAQGTTNSLLGLHLSPAAETNLAISIICAGSSLLLIGVLILNQSWIREAPLAKETAKPWRETVRTAFAWRPSQAPDFARLYISRCVLNLGIFIGADFLFFYVQDVLAVPKGQVPHEVIFIALSVTMGGVLGALLGGRLGDVFSKRTLLYFFCSLAALAATGFCVTDSIPMARGIGFFYGIGASAIGTLDWAFATSLVPRGQEARYLAIFQTCFYLPQIVVGLGAVVGESSTFRVLFWSIPVWLIAGMLLLSRVREPREIMEI
jgi:MFS family permease